MKISFKSKKYADLTDQELVEVFQQQRDKNAAGELFKRYAPLVMGTCLKYLKDEKTSEDAVMAIFEKLMEKIHEFEIQHFKSWLYQVSKNHCLMALRKNKSTFKQKGEWEKDFLSENVNNNSFVHLNTEEDVLEDNLSKMREALQQLKPEQRQCIELFYLEGKSYQQVAEITGFTIKSVKSYLQNGKKNLQKIILSLTLLPILWLVETIERLILK